MVSRDWLIPEPVVTLEKYLNTGSIIWNSHFTDPSYGEWATKLIVNELGTTVNFNVKIKWNDVYGNHYSVYRIYIDKRNAAGNWVLETLHEPNSSQLGDPAMHSQGHRDLQYSFVADDVVTPIRIRVAVKTGESLPTPTGSSGNWTTVAESRQFQIEARKCICNR